MGNPVYIIENRVLEQGSDQFKELLLKAYRMKTRPLCNCKKPAIEMYVSKVGNEIIIKRMPNSGSKHHPNCSHYEVPLELSGLGQVAGVAIKEDLTEGVTNLALGFSLSKNKGREAPVPTGIEHDSVKSDGTKLTMRGLLHHLWETSKLNVWYPAMESKRNWFVVRRELIKASSNNVAKKMALDSLLFVPENFKLEDKENITKRRKSALKHLHSSKSSRPLMMVLGEVKQFEPTSYGQKMIIKHMPDYHFMMDSVLFSRMEKRFEIEMEFLKVEQKSHLMVLATFGLTAAGYATIEEMTLMIVNENWMPYESLNELELIQALTTKKKKYIKTLRYNLQKNIPLASVVVMNDEPTACYISDQLATEESKSQIIDLMKNSDLNSWYWNVGVDVMPSLPS